MEYNDLNKFSSKERKLIMQNKAIFNNEDALPCPNCNREKSPATETHASAGPCLYCIEDALKNHKSIALNHLPERWPADAYLIQMAHEIIEKYHSEARGADIAYILKAKHGETNGKIVLGSCARQSPKAKLLHGWDYIIELAWDMWALCDDMQKNALLLHELCHIRKDDGQWKIEPHSVEEHVKVINAFGLWKPDIQAFADAIKDCEEDGDEKQMKMFNTIISPDQVSDIEETIHG